MDYELQERFLEWQDRLRSDVLIMRNRTRQIAKNLSRKVGEGVIMPPQARLMAYLLGFNPSREMVTAIPVPVKEYQRKILPYIPKEGRINIRDYGYKGVGHLSLAFKRPAVEHAFRKLDEKGLVRYTEERFSEALKYV